MVRVTFLPEGRTVEFEYGTLPYGHHGKPMSFLDVAEHFDIFLDHACGGVLRLHHLSSYGRRTAAKHSRRRMTMSWTGWIWRRICNSIPVWAARP